jgi:hypothetical protein
VRLSIDEIEEVVDAAREDLSRGVVTCDFARALVQLSGACTVGMPCVRHSGVVHGQEAEELRAGVEQILRDTSGVSDEDAVEGLAATRQALIVLLDHIDARDSLAFREVTDHPDEETSATA